MADGVTGKSEPRPAATPAGQATAGQVDPAAGNSSFDFEIDSLNAPVDNIAREHLPTSWSSYDFSSRMAKVLTSDFRTNSAISSGGPMVGVVLAVYKDGKPFFNEFSEMVKSAAGTNLSNDSNPLLAIKVRVPGMDPWPIPQSEQDLGVLAMYPTYIAKDTAVVAPKPGDLVYVSYRNVRARIGPTYEGPVISNGASANVPLYAPGVASALANASPKLSVDCAIKEKAKAAGIPPEQGAKAIEESKQADAAKAEGDKSKDAKVEDANTKKQKKKATPEFNEVDNWDEICSETVENPPGLEGFYSAANVDIEDMSFGSMLNYLRGLESTYKKLFRLKYNAGRLRRIALAAATYYRIPPECPYGVIYMECHWRPIGLTQIKDSSGRELSSAYGMGQIKTKEWYRRKEAIARASGGRTIHHGLLLDPKWGLWGCAAMYCSSISTSLEINRRATKGGKKLNWSTAATTAMIDSNVSDGDVKRAVIEWSGKYNGNHAAALWTGNGKSPATLRKMVDIHSKGFEVYWPPTAVTNTSGGWKKLGPVFDSDLVPPWGGAPIDISQARERYSFFSEDKNPPPQAQEAAATVQSGGTIQEDRSPSALEAEQSVE